MDCVGIVLERQMQALDSCFTGGHGVIRFENLRVPATQILGAPGRGMQNAQVRLAPARLTHCMRWLGQAQRAHDVALRYSTQRQAFGKSLIEHEGVGFMLADNEMDLRTARLSIWHTAWILDRCTDDLRVAGHESSMTKVIVSEAVWRVVDRAVQVLGGNGVTDETIVARIFRDMRAFRIYDGPSETHRWSIAKQLARRSGARA
jgi:acyl-CoA dehydrogenase